MEMERVVIWYARNMGTFIEHRPKNFYTEIMAEVPAIYIIIYIKTTMMSTDNVRPYSTEYEKTENLCIFTSNII